MMCLTFVEGPDSLPPDSLGHAVPWSSVHRGAGTLGLQPHLGHGDGHQDDGHQDDQDDDQDDDNFIYDKDRYDRDKKGRWNKDRDS